LGKVEWGTPPDIIVKLDSESLEALNAVKLGFEEIPNIPLSVDVPQEIQINSNVDIPSELNINHDIPGYINVNHDIPSNISVSDSVPSQIDLSIPPNPIQLDVPSMINVSHDIPSQIGVSHDIPSQINVSDSLPSDINIIGVPETVQLNHKHEGDVNLVDPLQELRENQYKVGIKKNSYDVERYESKDSENNDLIRREIKAHEQKHSEKKDVTGMSKGHYPRLSEAGHYQKENYSLKNELIKFLSVEDEQTLNFDYEFSAITKEINDKFSFDEELTDAKAKEIFNIFLQYLPVFDEGGV
jgi:hypothetical protein